MFMRLEGTPAPRLESVFDAEETEVLREERPAAAKFCSLNCRLNYREERISGVEFPSASLMGEKVHFLNVRSALDECAYCSSKLNTK